jgi:hypothetical protein
MRRSGTNTSRSGWGKAVILWDEMLHLRGFSQDGLVGLNPVEVAREAFGLAIGNQDYAGEDHRQRRDAERHPEDAEEDGQAGQGRLPEVVDGAARRGDNRAAPAILDEGMEWVAMGFKPVDAQFLEQRKFDITEIARIFDLPPHKLMDLDRSTNNNIEHQGIEYVMDAILPRAVNWEETLERDLFLPSDQGRYFIECNVEGLMRGDSAARAAFYTKMFNVGALRPNDILGRRTWIRSRAATSLRAAQHGAAQAGGADARLPTGQRRPPTTRIRRARDRAQKAIWPGRTSRCSSMRSVARSAASSSPRAAPWTRRRKSGASDPSTSGSESSTPSTRPSLPARSIR